MFFLTVNCGSSSLKVDLLDPQTQTVMFSDQVDRIGNSKGVYEKSLSLLVSKILQSGVISDLEQINVVCHRVVHGGDKYEKPVLITRRVKTDIFNLGELAPLHNPYNLEGIYAAEKLLKCPQFAVFDTAFHRTMPLENQFYAIPYHFFKKHGIKRYGFHGISHKYIADKAGEVMKNKRVRLISCHLGSGCSLAAIRNGESQDCSMGFTPLEGVPMSTRSGNIDAAMLFYLNRKLKLSWSKLEDMLIKESGLLGISEYSADMRDLLDPPRRNKAGAMRAVNFFCNKVARMLMSQVVTLQRLDAIVFTAGIGEGSAEIRKLICQHLTILGVKLDASANQRHALEISHADSLVRVFVIPTNESLQMAKEVLELIR